MKLNNQQQEALKCINNSCIVIAGAGSGKTSTMVSKIVYLVAEQGYDLENILITTFSRKAADEIMERVFKVLKEMNYDIEYTEDDKKKLWINTLHGVGYKIIRQNYRLLNFINCPDVPQDYEIKNFINKKMKKYEIPKECSYDSIVSYISMRKRGVIKDEDIDRINLDYEEIRSDYVKWLFDNNYIDFNDMIVLANVILANNEDIKAEYQDFFQYIIVDEFQDTDPSQYRMLSLLSDFNSHVTVVGDDDQVIYGFRGSDPRVFSYFLKHYKGSKKIYLEQNYRSTKAIIDMSNRIIKNNKFRFDKVLYTKNDEGKSPLFYEYDDYKKEAKSIVEMIEGDLNESEDETIAILFRCNHQSAFIEDLLIKKQIDYINLSGFGFYERKEIKHAYSYLRSIFDQRDEEVINIINVPNRYIGHVTVDKIKSKVQFFSDDKFFNHINDFHEGLWQKQVDSLRDFVYLIEKHKYKEKDKDDIVEILENIYKDVNYYSWLKEDDCYSERMENISAFQKQMKEYDNLKIFLDHIDEIKSYRDKKKGIKKCRLILSTVHKAKGLEWDRVYIIGCSELMFPKKYRDSLIDMEEERRLFYVACTRARKQLILSRYIEGIMWTEKGWIGTILEPSRFIKEAGLL